MRILLIEDDAILADRLVASLTSHNYVVDAVDDGQLGLEYAQGTSYDLILTDVGLPHLSGIDLCQRLRTAGCSTPILLMTARDAPDERVRGLDAGADDHLTKPLNLDELHARLRALLRRGEVAATPVLEFGPLRLDPVSCQVTYSDQPLKLTPKEYNLLELFLRNPTRVFSRGQIIEHLWNFDDPPLEESVKAHVKGLRRKLKQVGDQEWIENVYGLGYRLNPALQTGQASQQPSDGSAQAIQVVADPVPTAEVEQDFRRAMGGLWQQYQGLMTQRVEALQAAAQAIAEGTMTVAVRQAAAQAAHKLAGVLGMFENDAGTAIARQIETLLEAGTAAADQAVSPLIEQLIGLMDMPAPAPPDPPASGGILLVGLGSPLDGDLQALATAAGQRWASVATLPAAQEQIQRAVPEKLILTIPAASQWADSLAFLQGLAQQSPPVATTVITAADSLVDRVAIAQTGIQRLLVQPVTAAEVWATLNQTQRRDQLARAQVLVVDDDPLVLAALRPLLEPWGMRVVGLTSPQTFWDTLNSVAPDLLILDVEMPQFSGIELCQAVRTDPHWQNLPILFLTAHQDRETVQQVFAAGADDFIAKPIFGPELLTRLLNRLDRNQLIRSLSTRDPLTGLLNYAQSRQQLDGLMQQAATQGAPLSVALLRLSDLSELQGQYGPDVVHQILQHWGYQLQTSLRSPDVAGYWGNGELVVGLPGLTPAEAADQLAPFLQRLRQHILVLPGGDRLQPTCTTAVGERLPGDADVIPLYQRLRERSAGQPEG